MRALCRIVGFLLVAAGFVATVMDGARSIAASDLDYARLGETAFRALGERFLLLQPGVERHLHPLLWDPFMLNLLLLPTSLVLLGLGFLLLRLGRRRAEPIGQALRG